MFLIASRLFKKDPGVLYLEWFGSKIVELLMLPALKVYVVVCVQCGQLVCIQERKRCAFEKH